MKRLLAPVVLAAALVLTGCSISSNSPSGPPDLTGAWKQSNSASADAYQQATITTDTITVEWVADGGDTVSTYWVGTYDAPKDASAAYKWTSKRDVAATDSALLASQDDTKDFTYEGDTISYKVTALGTTTTVKLKKK